MFCENKITHDLSRARKFFEDIISYTAGPYKLKELISEKIGKINILDVRDYDDYTDGHIPYASHLPLKNLKEECEILDKDKVTFVYSYSDSCPRAYKAALLLAENKHPAVVLRGGFREWKKFDFDIVKSDSESEFHNDNE